MRERTVCVQEVRRGVALTLTLATIPVELGLRFLTDLVPGVRRRRRRVALRDVDWFDGVEPDELAG
ncbi:hypothetical protein FTX61_13255 [Nitriliruptoraceae bacterium ZYF776]|nr:hypothetical protein [Profundirhabdus halotolerans]